MLSSIVLAVSAFVLHSKSVILTTTNTIQDGANLILPNINNDVSIDSVNNEWDINVGNDANDQQGYHIEIHLDNSWGFHPNKVSSITFTMYSNYAYSSVSDLDMFISFSVNNNQYFTLSFAYDNNLGNLIWPFCGTSMATGNVKSCVDQYQCAGSTDREEKAINGLSWNQMQYLNPNNYLAGNRIGFPTIFILQNDPVSNQLSLTITTPTWQLSSFYQSCTLNSFPTNNGLDIYIAIDDEGEECSFYQFAVEYSYELTSEPTNIPTASPTMPSVSPTNIPTNIPSTNYPTKPPTKTPSKTPTDIPTNMPSTLPTNFPTVPSALPTNYPTKSPTKTPSKTPTDIPITASPTRSTEIPTHTPTKTPTNIPTISEGGVADETTTTTGTTRKELDIDTLKENDGKLNWIYIVVAIGGICLLIFCLLVITRYIYRKRKNTRETALKVQHLPSMSPVSVTTNDVEFADIQSDNSDDVVMDDIVKGIKTSTTAGSGPYIHTDNLENVGFAANLTNNAMMDDIVIMETPNGPNINHNRLNVVEMQTVNQYYEGDLNNDDDVFDVDTVGNQDFVIHGDDKIITKGFN